MTIGRGSAGVEAKGGTTARSLTSSSGSSGSGDVPSAGRTPRCGGAGGVGVGVGAGVGGNGSAGAGAGASRTGSGPPSAAGATRSKKPATRGESDGGTGLRSRDASSQPVSSELGRFGVACGAAKDRAWAAGSVPRGRKAPARRGTRSSAAAGGTWVAAGGGGTGAAAGGGGAGAATRGGGTAAGGARSGQKTAAEATGCCGASAGAGCSATGAGCAVAGRGGVWPYRKGPASVPAAADRRGRPVRGSMTTGGAAGVSAAGVAVGSAALDRSRLPGSRPPGPALARTRAICSTRSSRERAPSVRPGTLLSPRTSCWTNQAGRYPSIGRPGLTASHHCGSGQSPASSA